MFKLHTSNLLVHILLIVTMACSFLLLPSCAPKGSSTVLEESLDYELGLFKDKDSSAMERFIDYMDLVELEQFDIVPMEFAEGYFDGFRYAINGIYVGEDHAEIRVTLTMKDFSSFEGKLEDDVELLLLEDAQKEYSSDRFKELYGEAVMECLEETPAIKHEPITIRYAKDGNAWRPSTSIIETLMAEAVNDL